MKKDELDEQFFDDDATIPSINTIFSYEPAPPEMGFFAPGYKKLENQEQRKKGVQQALDPYSTGEGGRRSSRKEIRRP